MKRTCILIITLALAGLASPSRGAEPVKLKYLNSILTDAAGVALAAPEGVACSDGRVLVVDSGNHRLLSYKVQDRSLQMESEYPMPTGFPIKAQTNSKGDLYVLDSKDRQIKILGSNGAPRGDLQLKGVPGSQKIVPRSFLIDETDTLYILDIFSGRVVVADGSGGFVRQVAFPAEYGFFSDLALDGQGNILLVDSVEARVYQAGKEEEVFSPRTASLKEYMNFPISLTPDGQGNLLLVDRYGSGIAVVGPDGGFLGRKLGMGWGESQLHYPSDICRSPDGRIFIADTSNNRVQQFTLEQ